MKTNSILFWILAAFMGVVAAVYTFWSLIDPAHGTVEWAGTITIGLSAVLSAFIAFYLGRAHNAQGGELPEDRLEANIDDGDAEQGFFSPWSWSPVLLAAGLAVVFTGLAVGIWVAFIGLPFAVLGLLGWMYEYYRGHHAH